ncbi:glycoside hydrolase family 28 protein [Plebeiibacterium marinum]|uniref:Glycoside hydrolase family 28 protein n=1 Tax=Plebeiibacterium marinum TaxID=2992111 RepID=A0AAE3MHF6_9BACT|nr:glycoside hydrolase family 28 protein [Plebeiobacterium marinum]MCW3807122.1 glycoside hydrolase family 28 protein [Plebeiobacterium marinum]
MYIRHIIILVFLIFTLWIGGCSYSDSKEQTKPMDSWQKANEILKDIKAPVFPDKTFHVSDFGAIADGISDCSKAFKNAIDACHNSGGGRVVVSEGDYLTGPIYLKSNVNLHLAKGARIMFSTNPNDYLPVVHTRWEGVELMNYSPLVYAYKEKNIAITGEGILDGQASKENWWAWHGRTKNGWKEGDPNQFDPENRPALFEMCKKGVPVSERVFGEGHYLRPQFLQPYLCENVLLQGFTIKNSPMWILHPVLCNNVIIKGVNVDSRGPNTDGCDPESCKNVLIDNCTFNTGDDCIALKSGRNEDGHRIDKPIENVIVRNCKMKDGHGGFVVGSEISAGAKNIFVEDCNMDSPHLTRAIRIKTNSARGGVIEKVYMRNLEVGKVSESLLKINLFYEDGEGHEHTPQVKDIWLENVTCKSLRFPLFLLGYEDSKISGIKLKNIVIENAKEASIIRNVSDITMEDIKIQTSREVNLWGTVNEK